MCFPISSSSMCCLFFFFSSRRRHTRCSRDWSSDVCSSDLVGPARLEVHQEKVGDGIGGVDPVTHARVRPDEKLILHRLRMTLHCLFLQFAKRSEEHTSELQSRLHLVCRLLLGKKRHRAPGTALT